MNDTDSLFTLLYLGILMLVPFLVGRKVESARNGLILLSVIPLLMAIAGVLLYFVADRSPDEETRDWAGIWLGLLPIALVFEVIAAVGWGLGRLTRRKSNHAARKTAVHEFPELSPFNSGSGQIDAPSIEPVRAPRISSSQEPEPAWSPRSGLAPESPMHEPVVAENEDHVAKPA